MAVQILARSVVAHRGARVGVTGSDLDMAQVDACVEHSGDEGVAEHVRVCPGGLDARACGEPSQAAGGRVPVHPAAAAVEQDRPMRAVGDGSVNGPADGRRQRYQDNLGALAAHAQHPVSMLFPEVGNVCAGGLEDPQAEQPKHGDQREVAWMRRLAGGGEQGLELQVGEAQGG